MDSSPPSPKRICLDEEVKWEDLPEHIWDKIFRFLPMKDRIHSSSVSKRWRLAMPYTDEDGCLHVTDLPFKAELKFAEYSLEVVSDGGITAALESLLPQKQIDSKLKSLSFDPSDDRGWQMAASHLDLIAQHCPNLTELKLVAMHDAERSDFNFEAMRRLTHLTSLNLQLREFPRATRREDNSQLNREISSLITTLTLKQLGLSFFDFWPSAFPGNLTSLSVENCKRFGDSQLAQICQTSPNLTDLTIDDCKRLEDFTPIGQLRSLTTLELKTLTLDEGDMELIARNCTNLNSLELYEVKNVGKFTWLRHLGQLKEFFSDWPGLNDSDVADLPNNWSIEELEMTDFQLTDDGLARLSHKCPLLKRLILWEFNNITNVGIDKIAASWDQLESLKINKAKITGDSVAKLGQRKKLQLLVIDDCEGINSAEGFELLLEKRRQLGISTPLWIKFDTFYMAEANEMISQQLKEQLGTVRVELIQVEVTAD